MRPQPGSEGWSEGLRLISYCPVCETRYNPMEARMLGKDGETHLLHVQCRKCHHNILALVLVNNVGTSSVGLLTDLTYEDVLSFKSQSQVSLNDVIDTHETLTHGLVESLLRPVQRQQIKRVRKKQKKLKDDRNP